MSTKTEPDRIEPDRLYTYDEAAAVLGVTRWFVKNAVMDGRIASHRLNPRRGVRRIRGQALLDWLDAGGER